MTSGAPHQACSTAPQAYTARQAAPLRRTQVAARAAARGSGASGPAAAAPPIRTVKQRSLLAALVQQAQREVVDGWLGDLVLPLLTDDPGAAEPPPVTRAPRDLADPDSLFAEVDGVSLHYKESWPAAAATDAAVQAASSANGGGGSGEAAQRAAQLPTILLVHGFNGSVFNWRSVMQPLADATGCRCACSRDGPMWQDRVPALPNMTKCLLSSHHRPQGDCL